ncbi:hypothetical protein [Actinobacillus pleuropneumoniae]|uniref:hypothetical protein n=1 Tax=Actinobacillus pleuropneumoniae TaxID=715 RepID=UPI003F7C0220
MKENKFSESVEPLFAFSGEQLFVYTCYGLAILLLVIAIFNSKLLLQMIGATITIVKTTVITALFCAFVFSVLGVIKSIFTNF